MIEIIHHGGITRVWLNEPPPDTAHGILTIEHSVGSSSTSECTLRCASLEVIRNRHNSSYGLLGAEMLPDNRGRLLLRLSVVEEQTNTSLPYRLYQGLPEDYGRAVIDGVTAHPSWPLLGSGVLSFSWAKYDLPGSSYVVFRWLGWRIVQMLLHGHPEATESEISALLHLGTRPIWKDPAGEDSA